LLPLGDEQTLAERDEELGARCAERTGKGRIIGDGGPLDGDAVYGEATAVEVLPRKFGDPAEHQATLARLAAR
jgi:hypothetical protein